MNKIDLKLPEKLSDLLEISIKDALAAKAKGYKLQMKRWQRASKGNKPCEVCMAGAVLAMKAGVPRKQDISWGEELEAAVTPELKEKLLIINNIRIGYIEGIGPRHIAKSIQRDYDSDRDGGRAKWSTYRQAVKDLRALGL